MIDKNTIMPAIHSAFSHPDIGFSGSVRPQETDAHILS